MNYFRVYERIRYHTQGMIGIYKLITPHRIICILFLFYLFITSLNEILKIYSIIVRLFECTPLWAL